MAVYFGATQNSTRYYSASDHSAWDVGASSQASFIAIIEPRNVVSPSTTYQYFYSSGGFQSANAINIWHADDDAASEAERNYVTAHWSNSLTISVDTEASGKNLDSGKPWIVCLSRDSSDDIHLRVAEFGDSTVLSETSSTLNNSDAISGPNHLFGRRDVSSTSRYFDGVYHNFYKLDTHVTDDQLLAVINGADPFFVFGGAVKVAVDFRAEDTVFEHVNGITFTKNGTGYQTEGSHILALHVRSLIPVVEESLTVSTFQINDLNWHINDTGWQINDLVTPAAGATPLAFVSESEEGCNINNASSLIANPTLMAPAVTLVPYTTQSENGDGSSFWAFVSKMTGGIGKTPTFSISNANLYNNDWNNLNPVWSNDGKALSDRTKTWNFFDNVNDNAGTLEFSNNSAFTGSQVYVASHRPVQWSLLDDWLTNVWDGDALVQETSSSTTFGGEDYQIATVASDTDDNGLSLPAQNQRCFWVTNTGASPDDGQGKRDVLLISGMHSPEDVGTESWIAAVNFLLAADSGGDADQQAAARLVKNFRWWCSAWVNPGRYFHHDRGYAVVGGTASDPNRDWDGVPGLSYVTSIRDAFEADVGAAAVDAAFDFHAQSQPSDPDNEFYVQPASNPGTHRAVSLQWQTYLDTYVTATETSDVNWNGSTQEWAATTYGARVASTCEQSERAAGINKTTASTAAHARAALRALDDAWQAGYFATLTADDATVSTESVDLSVINVGGGTIELEADDATVSTESVSLRARGPFVPGQGPNQQAPVREVSNSPQYSPMKSPY